MQWLPQQQIKANRLYNHCLNLNRKEKCLDLDNFVRCLRLLIPSEVSRVQAMWSVRFKLWILNPLHQIQAYRAGY